MRQVQTRNRETMPLENHKDISTTHAREETIAIQIWNVCGHCRLDTFFRLQFVRHHHPYQRLDNSRSPNW